MSAFGKLRVLRIESSAIPVEVLLNGIPLAYLHGGHEARLLIQEPDFLAAGRNDLDVIVHAGPIASRAEAPWRNWAHAPEESQPAFVRVRIDVQSAEDVGLVPVGEPLVELEWAGAAFGQPARVSRHFVLPATVPASLWQRAQPLDLTKDRSEIDVYVKGLHELLQRRDLDGFLATQELRFREAARVISMDTRVILQPVRSALERALKPPYVLSPIPPTGLDLRPLREGRLVQVTVGARRAPLHFSRPDNQNHFEFSLILGRIDGRLETVA